jgi:hypothetical protein
MSNCDECTLIFRAGFKDVLCSYHELQIVSVQHDRYRKALRIIENPERWDPGTFNELMASVARDALKESDDE